MKTTHRDHKKRSLLLLEGLRAVSVLLPHERWPQNHPPVRFFGRTTLARIAGHSSIAMSMRYVHPSENAVLNAMSRLADLSQLRAFFGFFALIFMVKASVFSGSPPGSGRVETKCLPFDNALLAVCRWHVSA